jgi:4-hydroxy-tetrahydrodipicolinate synthase
MTATLETPLDSLAQGVWAASLTPLNQDLDIDRAALGAHLESLLANGCDGVVLFGTTGEANSFSLPERLDLIASLAGLQSERTLIGVGCCAQADTVTLTRASLDAGFVNVLMLPPFYYKNVSDDGLFSAYARTIERVGDARLRVVIYDIPPMVGFSLSVDLLARLRQAFPETVIGVKNSSGDWTAIESALKALPGFQVFAGSEQFLLATLRAGGPGCISAFANVTSAQLGQLHAARRGEGADALQAEAVRIRHALRAYPTIAALKEIMARRTGRPTWRLVRPPLSLLSAAQAASLAGLLGDLGL